MERHSVKLRIDANNPVGGSEVLLDDKPLHGVQRIAITLDVRDPTKAHVSIDMYADVTAEAVRLEYVAPKKGG